MPMKQKNLDQLCINTIRTLAMDAVQAAADCAPACALLRHIRSGK